MVDQLMCLTRTYRSVEQHGFIISFTYRFGPPDDFQNSIYYAQGNTCRPTRCHKIIYTWGVEKAPQNMALLKKVMIFSL